MAVKLYCPECDAPFVYAERDVETDITCPGCAGTYRPSEARRDSAPAAPASGPRPIPGYRPPRSRRDDDEDEDDRPRRRRRRRGRYYEEEAAQRLAAPSIFLMVIAFLQLAAHLCIGGMFVLMGLTEGKEAGPVLALVGAIGLCLGCLKDFFVLRGAFAMRNRRGYGAAMAGAIIGCLPDVGWILALIPGIWCLVVLNDPQVKRAFEEHRRDYDDDYDF